MRIFLRYIIFVMVSLVILSSFTASSSILRTVVPPLADGSTQPDQSSIPMPRFVSARCPMNLTVQGSALKYIEGKNILCGYLIVKEDRQNVASPDIHLAVAIIKSSSPHPAPDPLIMLQGGPGGALLKDFDFFVSAGGIKSEVGNRDIILIDQRGTGFSKPSLICPELTNLQDTTIQQLLTQEQNIALTVHAYSQCHQRLINSHINLNAYTTYNDANDIHDLITALKLPGVNLYGVSYGTRLVLEVMRSFPERVRSVILDSTVPSNLHFYESIPHDYSRVFQTLFQSCMSDPVCSRQHPDLAARFYRFIAATDQHPITMALFNPELGKSYPKAVMRGYDIFLGFWQFFYITNLIPALPKIMDEVMAGNYTIFARFFSLLAFDTSVSAGMYESVICGDGGNYSSKEQIAQTAQELNPALRSDVIQDLNSQAFDTCKTWNVKPVEQAQHQPVQSTIPALVLEGEYDPITPPTNGNEAARSLSHSTVVLFPATGHGTYLSGQACPVQIVLDFLNNPTQAPDTTCTSLMHEPTFF